MLFLFPHTDNGKLEARLRGIVTSRDVDFMGEECLDRPLNDVSARSGVSQTEGDLSLSSLPPSS